MFHWRRFALATVAVALAACGGSADSGGYTSGPTTNPGTTNPGTTNPGSVSTNAITVSSSTFDPAIVTISAGTTVNWTWNSCSAGDGYGGYNTCVTHQITFDDGSGIKSDAQSSGTFSRTFNAAGTYKYHCVIHGQSMSGQITVQ